MKRFFSNTRGFTMLEIMTVVIIISILSILAVTQYTKAVERQHGRNAITYLKTIRSAQMRYYMENNKFASDVNELDIEDTLVELKQYFTFETAPAGNGFTASANRIGSSSKITIDQDNKISTNDKVYEGIY